MNANKRANRIRFGLKSKAGGRIRLSVFRSLQHISVQAIDDAKGNTIAQASTNFKDFPLKTAKSMEKAQWVGQEIAKKLLAAKITDVYLDRGSYAYHGKIKALADAAREQGLNF